MGHGEPDDGKEFARPPASGADAESRRWLEGLRASGTQYDETVTALWSLLLQAGRRETRRRSPLLGISGPELDDLAHQAANDALVAILGKIDDFRGESRFTTWAYKFVMFEVSTKMGRHFWRNQSAAFDVADWEHLPERLAVRPEHSVELKELVGALREAVEAELTERQRFVFVAIALNATPVDAVTHTLGSNRNAIYKTLFDARRKLRDRLARAGVYPRGEPGI